MVLSQVKACVLALSRLCEECNDVAVCGLLRCARNDGVSACNDGMSARNVGRVL